MADVGSSPGEGGCGLGEEGGRCRGVAAEASFSGNSQCLLPIDCICFLRWQIRQAQISEQFPHEPLHLDEIPQGIWLCCVDVAGIAHFGQELGGDIVVGLDLVGEDGCAEEFFERVDDAVDELENEEGLDLGGGCDEKEKVPMCKAEDEGGRVRVGEVDEVRSRRGMFEEEGQQVCR